MSENRQKYSSSPLYGLKHARGGGGFQVPPPPQKRQGGGQRSFVFLQVAMSALLPLLFLLAMILRVTELHWAFLGLSLLSLMTMWGLRAFVPQARMTMSLIYAALMIVSLAAALWFTQPAGDRTKGQDQNADDGLMALFSNNVTASDIQNYGEGVRPSNSEQPEPTADIRSEVQSQLELFMNSWMSLDYNAMLSYCTPSWVNAQADPQHAIFKIRGTSTPVSYEIMAVSGSNADDSRTVTMQASIDKGTGKAPQDYRYEVLMLRVNNVWYVDPASLSSATEIKNEPTPTVTFTLMPTYSPDPGQTLYYNPDGGSFYHANDQCTSVSNKYLPLKGSFKYSQLNDEAYKKLQPCGKCSAPGRT